jgi:hypothetical protein
MVHFRNESCHRRPVLKATMHWTSLTLASLFAGLILCTPSALFAQRLVWDPNTESDIDGYRVYRGAESGVYTTQVDVGNVTSYVPEGVDWTRRQFFTVRAYNTSGLESPPSNEAAWTPPSITTVTALQPSAAYPLLTGHPVAWTATASNNLGPVEYQFWQYRRNYWVMVQDYGPSNRWIWTPQAGDIGAPYSVQVWVRSVGSTAHFEAWRSTPTFAVEAAPVPPIAANVDFPTPPGNQVTWTATLDPAGTTPLEYKFLVLDQNTNTWTVFRDYEPSRQAHWIPEALGRYVVQVWARPTWSTAEYELQASTPPFDVAITPVTVKALYANLSFPAATGTPITWTSRVQGGLAGPLQYTFWLNKLGAGWSNPQPYSPSETFTWTPTWGEEGEYWLQVWVRSNGSTAFYEHWRSTTSSFKIQRASLHLTTSTLFPVSPIAPVTWTANVPDPTVTLEYQFWVYSSTTNQWSLGQSYGPSNTFTWIPGVPGSYTIQAWARQVGSTATYEVYRGTNFLQVSDGPALMLSLTASVALPAQAGTTITWTAAANGGTALLEYQFWRQDGSNWTMVQDYGPLNSYTWITSSGDVGEHQIQALVRSTGSSEAFESQMYTGVFSIQP